MRRQSLALFSIWAESWGVALKVLERVSWLASTCSVCSSQTLQAEIWWVGYFSSLQSWCLQEIPWQCSWKCLVQNLKYLVLHCYIRHSDSSGRWEKTSKFSKKATLKFINTTQTIVPAAVTIKRNRKLTLCPKLDKCRTIIWPGKVKAILSTLYVVDILLKKYIFKGLYLLYIDWSDGPLSINIAS